MRRVPGVLRAGLAMATLAAGAGCGGGQATTGDGATTAGATPGPRITLALVHGTLVDGTGADPVANAVVLIAGDRIAAVGPAAQVPAPAGVETVDLGGATVLPGFINAHVHAGFDAANLQAWAEGGVTTVRDEDASVAQIEGLKAFRAQITKDPHKARLVSFGTMLAVPGGYGERYVASADEARAAVLDEIASGVDGIKIALEDGYAGQSGLPKLTPGELAAIVETAHAHGLPVSGHITQGAFLEQMLDAGVDDVAHLPYDAMPAGAPARMAAGGVSITPTFTVFRNYGVSDDALLEGCRQIVAAGGHVALGSDYAGGLGDFELGIPMYEVSEMAAAGMTPMQIVVASTKNAAHVLGLDDEIGTLEAGKAADILVVGGNPLTDLASLRNVRLVVHGGSIIRNELGG